VLGLTDHVDDDNPLWATLNEEGAFFGSAAIKAGMSRPAFTGFQRIEGRSRNAFRSSARLSQVAGRRTTAVCERRPASVFDIDRAHDVEAAEQAGLRWRENAGA
jgi:hypothetical protein